MTTTTTTTSGRSAVFAYGAVCYAVFFATFLYLVGFIGNLLVPVTMDGPRTAGIGEALLTDIGLLALFAIQHSVMARPAFKRRITRLIPESAERSTYVLASSLALIALMALWQPLGGVVWDIADPIARAIMWGVFGGGVLLVLAATFMINHFDLFGLRQAWFHATGRRPDPHVPFVARAFYRVVRHPLMLGFLVAFWSAPTMSVGHLLFAIATTGYIVIAVKFLEERDLVAIYGDTYREYQRKVPMLLPFGRR